MFIINYRKYFLIFNRFLIFAGTCIHFMLLSITNSKHLKLNTIFSFFYIVLEIFNSAVNIPVIIYSFFNGITIIPTNVYSFFFPLLAHYCLKNEQVFKIYFFNFKKYQQENYYLEDDAI